MSTAISNWIRDVFRRNNHAGNGIPSSRMVGAYPEEDTIGLERSSSISSRHPSVASVSKWLQIIVVKPVVVVLVIGVRLLAVVFNVIYFRKQETRIRSPSDNYRAVSQSHDPIDKVCKFVRDLEDNLTAEQLTAGASLPPFFEGSYTQALYMTSQRAKFLFVYLCNPHTEQSSTVFKHIITNPAFLSFFENNPHNIIWGGDITNPEAYQMANSLNVTKFPFLGLLCLTRSVTMTPSGPVKTPAKVSLVSKIQGKFGEDVDPKTLIHNKFTKKIEKFEEELGIIRAELRDRFLGQVILRQQDLNFQNSLARDRKKKEQKEREKLKKKYLIHRLAYFKEISQSTDTNGKARIAIKMPNGKRVTVHFPPDNTVEDLFTYVELFKEGYLENDGLSSTLSDTEAQAMFKDLEIQYTFSLSSPLPPRTVLDHLRSKEIKDVDCIYPNGLLHVENV